LEVIVSENLLKSNSIRRIPAKGGLLLLDKSANCLFAYNDTARSLWELAESGLSNEELFAEFAAEWGLSIARAAADVSPLLGQWRQNRFPKAHNLDVDPSACRQASAPDWCAGPDPEWTLNWVSTIRGIAIEFAVENDLAAPIYAMFQHLETPSARPQSRIQIRNAGQRQRVIIRGGVERLRTDNVALLIGGLWQTVLESLHPGVDWLAIIHGAAFAKNGSAIGLCGASGSGKTTLVAGLFSRGFDYLADDMIFLTVPAAEIVPLPLPLSVKPGSLAVLSLRYPELADAKPYLTKGLDTRLLAPPMSVWELEPIPLRKLVFPRYQHGAKAELVNVSSFGALQRLLTERIWLGNPITEERVKAFLAWLYSTSAFAITYGNLDDGLRLIEEILP
jgi:hypothetical protein